MKPIYWIIAAVAGVIIWKKYQMSQSLTYTIQGISIGGSLLNPGIVLALQVNNPTMTSADLDSINANVIVNNNIVGVISQTIPQTIAANTSTIINIPVALNVGNAISDVINILQSQQANVEIKGSITADLIPIPLDITYNI